MVSKIDGHSNWALDSTDVKKSSLQSRIVTVALKALKVFAMILANIATLGLITLIPYLKNHFSHVKVEPKEVDVEPKPVEPVPVPFIETPKPAPATSKVIEEIVDEEIEDDKIEVIDVTGHAQQVAPTAQETAERPATMRDTALVIYRTTTPAMVVDGALALPAVAVGVYEQMTYENAVRLLQASAQYLPNLGFTEAVVDFYHNGTAEQVVEATINGTKYTVSLVKLSGNYIANTRVAQAVTHLYNNTTREQVMNATVGKLKNGVDYLESGEWASVEGDRASRYYQIAKDWTLWAGAALMSKTKAAVSSYIERVE